MNTNTHHPQRRLSIGQIYWIYSDQTLLDGLTTPLKLSDKSTLNWKNILSINGDDKSNTQAKVSGYCQRPHTFLSRLNARLVLRAILYILPAFR